MHFALGRKITEGKKKIANQSFGRNVGLKHRWLPVIKGGAVIACVLSR